MCSRRPRTARRSPTSRASSTSPSPPSATTSPPPSARRAPATGWRPYGRPGSRGGAAPARRSLPDHLRRLVLGALRCQAHEPVVGGALRRPDRRAAGAGRGAGLLHHRRRVVRPGAVDALGSLGDVAHAETYVLLGVGL